MAVLSADFLAELNQKVINPSFEIAKNNFMGISSTIKIGGAVAPEGGYKYRWLNQKIESDRGTVNGAILAAVTALVLDSTTNFRVGMQISVVGSEEVMFVTAVVSATGLTVTRGFGGTTAADIADNAVVVIDSVAREENSTGVDDNMFEPETAENFFQILDTQLTFSRRALAQAQIGNYNDARVQAALRMEQLMYKINNMAIKGRKANTTIGSNTHSTAGGLRYYCDQTGGNLTDHGGGALTLAGLDAMTERVVLAGGKSDTLAVNTKQARVIQGLINANYQSQRINEQITDRGALITLSSDLPILGNVNRIVIDTNLNDSELFMYDSGTLSYIPMAQGNADASGNWRSINATQPGQDGESLRIVGDWTLEAKNFKTHLHRLNNIG